MKLRMFTLLVVLVMSASAALAQGGPGAGTGPGQGRGPGPGGMQGPYGDPDVSPRHARLVAHLGLSDAQEAEWRRLHEEFREATRLLRETHAEARARLRDALQQGAGACAVGDLMLDNHRIAMEIRAQREALENDLMSILDEEQKARYEAFRAARGGARGMGGPGGPRQGRGPGPRCFD
jgi:hypothetical protein